jgi:hypothetical protein
MEITYSLRLGQLLKIAPYLNKYMWQKLKPIRPNIVTKVILEASTTTMIQTHSKVNIVVINANNQMAIIQV